MSMRTVRDGVPASIDSAVAKALAKVPADRFASAAEFAAALEGSEARSRPGLRRRPLTVAAGVAAARDAAWELTKGWTFAQRLEFQAEVARRALDAQGPGGRTARDLARELLFAARAGLSAWAAETGEELRGALDPLEDVIARGTLAERALVVLQEARGDSAALVRFWQIA